MNKELKSKHTQYSYRSLLFKNMKIDLMALHKHRSMDINYMGKRIQ